MCIYRVQEKVTPNPKSVYKTSCAKYSNNHTLCRSCGAIALTIYGKASLPLSKIVVKYIEAIIAYKRVVNVQQNCQMQAIKVPHSKTDKYI